MDKIRRASININELIDAFGLENYLENAYLNTLTGEIINVIEDDDFF